MVLLEGSELVRAVVASACGVPGATSLPAHASDAKNALVPLSPNVCRQQRGFTSQGHPKVFVFALILFFFAAFTSVAPKGSISFVCSLRLF